MAIENFPDPDTQTTGKRTKPLLLVLGGALTLVVVMVVLHLTGVVG